MQTVNTTDRDFAKRWKQYLRASSQPTPAVQKTVARILGQVRRQGDKALFALTKRYDRCALSTRSVRISRAERKRVLRQVPAAKLRLLQRAARRIRRWHEQQKQADISLTTPQGRMALRWTPLARVGLYVPGGQAAYPSTVLMNAIPAQVAGVAELAMVTPTPGGKLNPYTIAAAEVMGIDEIYRIGGAQAVAALAYGTKSIPAVDKIVGPGNAYVASAKQQVFGTVDIDMIAGPTEVLILADGTADPELVASDLLSQAEHDPDARPVLISTSQRLLDQSLIALRKQLQVTPRRDIARRAIRRNGLAIRTSKQVEAIALANEMAAEHLVLMVGNPKRWLEKIRNAGAIFIGNYSPVASGDYTAGPNHVLPTAGTARFASPLGVYDFVKATSRLQLTRKGLAELAPDIVQLAELEGLAAHGDSVKARFK